MKRNEWESLDNFHFVEKKTQLESEIASQQERKQDMLEYYQNEIKTLEEQIERIKYKYQGRVKEVSNKIAQLTRELMMVNAIEQSRSVDKSANLMLIRITAGALNFYRAHEYRPLKTYKVFKVETLRKNTNGHKDCVEMRFFVNQTTPIAELQAEMQRVRYSFDIVDSDGYREDITLEELVPYLSVKDQLVPYVKHCVDQYAVQEIWVEKARVATTTLAKFCKTFKVDENGEITQVS